MTDLYELLGVERQATSAEIKRAYRAKAKTLHPDAGGSPEAFNALGDAYRVLMDDELRQSYDETGIATHRADNLRAGMLSIINAVLTDLMTCDQDLLDVDLAKVMAEAIEQQIEPFNNTITQGSRALDRARRMKGRWVTASEDNPFDRMLDDHIDQIGRAIIEARACIERRRAAIELLRTYSFTPDRPHFAWNFSAGVSTPSGGG